MDKIKHAIELLGGASAAAKLLEVSHQSVYFWMTGDRQIPAEKCPDIEALTHGAVTCEELRPGVNWAVLRAVPREPTFQ